MSPGRAASRHARGSVLGVGSSRTSPGFWWRLGLPEGPGPGVGGRFWPWREVGRAASHGSFVGVPAGVGEVPAALRGRLPPTLLVWGPGSQPGAQWPLFCVTSRDTPVIATSEPLSCFQSVSRPTWSRHGACGRVSEVTGEGVAAEARESETPTAHSVAEEEEENKTCFEPSDQTRKVSFFSSSCDLDRKPRLCPHFLTQGWEGPEMENQQAGR